MTKGVTEEPLPKTTFDRVIKSVLNLSGYFSGVTVYAIRRYFGKKIDSKLIIKSSIGLVLLTNE